MSLKDKIEDIFPLTPLQKGLLFHSLYEPESGVYFEQFHCRLEGDLSIDAFKQAWQILVDRHQILRTAIVTKGQTEPVQVVFRTLEFQIAQEDWRGLSHFAQKDCLQQFLQADKRQGFTLNRPPLMRVTLIRLAEQAWHMVWSHHHLILDGWSWPVLLREFLLLHKAAREGKKISLSPVRPYGNFIAWLKQQNSQNIESFWRQYIGDFESATPLLMIPKPNPDHDFAPQEIRSHFSPEKTALLQKLAQRCSVTLNTIIQGAWAILLNRYSRSEDIVYGITVAGRPPELPGVESMIGPFINTLPLRVTISGEQSLDDWLRKLQAQQAEMRQYEHSSLGDIQGWSQVPRGEPLFESLLAFENFPVDKSLKADDFGLHVPESFFWETTHYPVTLVVVPGEELSLKLTYNEARFAAEGMELLLQQFSDLLLNMARHAHAPLKSLSLLSPYVSQDLVQSIPDLLPIKQTLREIFAQTVRKYPNRIALTFESQNFTYQEIDHLSNRIARWLQSQGIGAEKRVVLCLERSPELIIAMLGVVKAGGVYVPVDPSYPRDRIEFTISDCQAQLILTTTAIRAQLPNTTPHICLDAADAAYLAESSAPLVPNTLEPDAGAYIIYTSGSTGKPKGVLVTQHNITRLFHSTHHWFQFNAEDVWTFFHSFAFDFSVWEIWGALLYGGRLVIIPYNVSRNPQNFLQLLQDQQVTVLNQTPSAFTQLLAAETTSDHLCCLRYIIFGGEALNLPSLRPWLERHHQQQTQLVNMYGITETTVHVTYRPINQKDIENSSGSLIGQPIPDLHLYLLDPDGNPLPPGIIGEIYVGGAGVARGYINRPELTAQRFVETAHGRLYRSGDLGRLLPNGDLEYLGRIDHQVKIRGFRIEIGEIEAAIAQFPDVQSTLVMVHTVESTDEKQLIAYVVCTPGQQPTIETLRQHLQQHLPNYMIPAQIVYLDQFPLTPNGKIDRKALPKPDIQRENLKVAFVPPATASEKTLAQIWQQVLGVNQVSRFDNYFILGGDSIRSIRICSLAQQAGLNLKLEQIFTHPILCDLAASLTEELNTSSKITEPFALVAPEDREKLQDWAIDAYPLAQLQAGMLFHGEYSQASTTYHDLFSFRIRIPFDLNVWQQAYAQMFERHPILRTAFYLGEYSQPLQAIVKQVSTNILFKDLTTLSPTQQDEYIKEFLTKERTNRFDWAKAPLIRFHIHLLDENVMQATCTLHHAIMDGWSLANFLAEITGIYLHLLGKGVPTPSAPPALLYSQFIAQEQQALVDTQQRQFWQNQLLEIPFTQIPRWPRPESQLAPTKMGKVDIVLDEATSLGLKNLSHQLGIPLKTLLLAIHLHTLSVFSGEEQVVTGLVSNGRPAIDQGDRILGLFLNTIPFRLFLPHGSWLDLINTTWQAEKALLPNRRFPLAEIQRLHHNQPLFETSFNFVHFHVYKGLLNWQDVELIQGESLDETNIPFAVSWSEEVAAANLSFNITFDRHQFLDSQISTIANYYQQACTDLITNPHSPPTFSLPSSFPLPLISSFSPIHQTFTQQAASHPNRIAVTYEGESWTYAQLNQKANQLARFLYNQGIRPEQPVGICLERSLEMVCAMLAVLKAGGCYVPIDPHYPVTRIQAMLEDAQVSLLLTRSDVQLPNLSRQLPQIFQINLDREDIALQSPDNLDTPILPEQIAYIIFTSGSTGRPKGIAISHQALAHHQAWFIETFAVRYDDVVLQKTPFSFDASVWEFWTPLMVGAKLVIAKPGGHQDPAYLVHTIQQTQVNLLQVVPTLLEILLLEPGFASCHSLRLVFSGGEALKIRVWQAFRQTLAIPLVNLYGPAEATIDVAYHYCRDQEITSDVPIGQAITNTRFYILNHRLEPVPIGTPGELYISSPQLARGYWNAPALSASHFLCDPFTQEPGRRMYRTGDRARYLSDGTIEFLGRLDQQVKIRGLRIETGEIVTTLESQPWVTRAVTKAITLPQQPQRLVAYLELQQPPENWQTLLRWQLSNTLPDYMVPSVFISLEAWPLLPNGKIDLNALPNLEEKDLIAHKTYIAPQTETETLLTQLWQQVLQTSRVGIEDNFFELGGDSILALQIIAKARDYGLYFTPQDLFQNPHIAALAPHVRKTAAQTSLPVIAAGDLIPLIPIQNWFFQQSLAHPEHWNLAVFLDIKLSLDATQLQTALNQIATVHPVFRLRFRQTAEGWMQYFAEDSSCNLAFHTEDLTIIAESELSCVLQTFATQYQGKLNLTESPLFCAVYFQTPENTSNKLLLVIHHLIVDGISWRVILQDLALACDALGQNHVVSLSTRRLGFLQWAQHLQTLTHNPTWQQDLTFWQSQYTPSFSLPLDFPEQILHNTEQTTAQINCQISQESTRILLYELPRTHKVRIQEVLLTVLLEAIAEWADTSEIVIALESHGRESELADNIDISDAVGWFTSIFPCKLVKTHNDLLGNLESVKQQLHRLPRNGFSYSFLSQNSQVSPLLPPIPHGILFNYLGQFEDNLWQTEVFAPATEDVGVSRHPENRRLFQLEITCLITSSQLQMRFGYSKALHRPETIQRLADSFSQHLQNLLDVSLAQGYHWTSADFPLVNLEHEQLALALAGATDVEDLYPLTPVQEGILFHTNYESQKDVYIQQVTGEMNGMVDVSRFQAAWQYCINRHSALRASFIWNELPRPVARIHHHATLPFVYEDWREFDAEQVAEKWSQLLETDRQQAFTTATAPIMRMTLVRTAAEKWRFLWTHHHLLLDGWSLPLVFQDVIAFYQTQQPNLSQPPSYHHFITWLNQQQPDWAQTFWQQQLRGIHSATSFGLSHCPNSTHQTLQTVLRPDIYTQLKTFAQNHQVTLNTLVQAAWGLLLGLYSGSQDVIFGVTVSGRPPEVPGFAEMVGLFINTLPVRLNFQADNVLQPWLQQLRDRLINVNQHSFSRLVDIQAWSDIPRGEPLFESIVIYENYPVEENLRHIPGDLAIHSVQSLERNHYPVSLYVLPTAEDLTLKIAFQSHVGEVAEREKLLEHFIQILTRFAQGKPQYIGDIGLVAKPRGLANINYADTQSCTIHELFSQQASLTPNAPAILYGDWLTYGELEAKSNQFAHTLQQMGVTKETLVAVCLERHPGLLIALLGILKAGAAYVPLDPAFPSDRLQWMLSDSAAAILVTEEKIAAQLPQSSAKVLLLDEQGLTSSRQSEIMLPTLSGNNHLAYVIYTSGSTGKPKGVQIQHQSVVNFLLSFREKLGLTAADTLVAVTTLAFDIAGLELFLPLLSGARLVLADRETTRDGFELAQLLQKTQATVMQATPTTWRLLLTAGWQPNGSFCALCGGEAMPVELAASLLECGVNLWNVYGPTETTIWSTLKAVKQPQDALSIGWGITNTSLYILDYALNPVPEGIVGELFIGGMGLARGYRQRTDLTAERFVPNPFSLNPGERLYRTGDLARWLASGEIQFLGRVDYQVKIRGFRIELGEIETILESHPAIAQGVVQAIETEGVGKKLVAYLVIKFDKEKPTLEALQSYLLEKLPDYMLPSAWVFLDAMPLTPNNKVDRRALPAPTQSNNQADYIAPRNTIEQALAEIWQELLQVEKVGVTDNFFQLGGHSLLAAQVHARIRKIFLIDLTLRDLFETVTVEEIAQLLLKREPQSGRTEKIAKAFLRLKQMTPEEKAKLLEGKRKTH